MLELPDAMQDSALPRRYTLQPSADILDMSVMSSEAGGDAPGDGDGGGVEALRLVKPRLDGTVSSKYDAVPTDGGARLGPGGAPAIDDTYRALTRKRTMASLQKGRSVSVITDNRAAQRLYQQQHNRASLYVKQTQADREEFEARSARDLKTVAPNRRVRMDRPELEQQLFRLFERQAHWALPALQKETDQPGAWLREVLGEVAVQVKSGPHKDTWELQKQFKLPGGGGAAGGRE